MHITEITTVLPLFLSTFGLAAPDDVAEVQGVIYERLVAIEKEETVFFEQLELANAHRSFVAARKAAEKLCDVEGQPVLEQVDVFHNYLDEFLRALDQLKTGPIPPPRDYGKDAIERAKRLAPMGLKDLRKIANRIRKELDAIKDLANEAEGLRDLDHIDARSIPVSGFAGYVRRVTARIEVITGSVGLGIMYRPAADELGPVRRSLIKLAQAANLVADAEGNLSKEGLKDFQEQLDETLALAKAMGRNAGVWRNPLLGNRGPLTVQHLEGLSKLARKLKKR